MTKPRRPSPVAAPPLDPGLERARRNLYRAGARPEDVATYRALTTPVLPPPPGADSAARPRRPLRGPVLVGVASLLALTAVLAVATLGPERAAPTARTSTGHALLLPDAGRIAPLIRRASTLDAQDLALVLGAVRAALEPPGATDAAITAREGTGSFGWRLGAIGTAAAGRTLRVVVVASPDSYGWTLSGRRSAGAAREVILAARGPARGAGSALASVVDVGVRGGVTDLRMRLDMRHGQAALCVLIVTE